MVDGLLEAARVRGRGAMMEKSLLPGCIGMIFRTIHFDSYNRFRRYKPPSCQIVLAILHDEKSLQAQILWV
jgi:hypothetical protein